MTAPANATTQSPETSDASLAEFEARIARGEKIEPGD
jgi:hypothetical protein